MERPERPLRNRRNNRYRGDPSRSDGSQNSRKPRGDRGRSHGGNGNGYRGKENERYGRGGGRGMNGHHRGRNGMPHQGGPMSMDRREGGRGGYRGGSGPGGHYRGNGGYRGGGRRGRSRGDRSGGPRRGGAGARGKREMCRFQERASNKLVEEVKYFNRYDMAGPHQVRMKLFQDTTWTARQSLTSGSFYFYDRETKRTTRKRPHELVGKEELKEIFDDQGSRFLKRPTTYPDHMSTVLVRTNTYQISGNILNFKVHQYFVEFDPPIPTTDFQRRQNVLLGNTRRFDKNYPLLFKIRKEQTRHREILQNLFGPFEFDNHCLYALGDEPVRGEKVLDELHTDFKVKFYLQDSLCLRSDDVPLTQREALLNIFNRKKLKNAGLSKIGRGWYCRSSRDPVDLQREVNIEYDIPGIPDVKIISGYDASIRVSSTIRNADGEQAVFKADLNHRLVTLRTVHDIIQDYRQRYPRTAAGDEDFRRAVETRLEKKNFILTYSNRHITIAKVDWTQDQNATFVLQTGGKISYKDYLQRQYHVQSNQKELCVIRDRSDSAFLPQHMRLTVTPTELGKVYDDILDNINVPIQERLDRIDHLVRRINQDDDEESEQKAGVFSGGHVPVDFRIDENGLEVKAVELDMPSITIQTANGLQAFRIDELKWHLTRGFLNKALPLGQWRVIYHRDSEDKANRIRAMWQEYCSRRNFNAQSGPIRCPYMHPIHTWDPEVCRDIVDPNDQMILLLLPNGDDGSKFKSLFTKIIQSRNFHNPVHVQCITEYQCSNKFAVLSIFEAMLAKHGHVLYHIDPVLPHDTKILVDSTWIMGLDVSHVQGKPSVCMLSLSRRPLEGSMRSLHFCAHLNVSGREIVPLVNMSMMVCQILEEAVAVAHREGQRLPSAIWFFRDGVADSQLKELHTKEVSGLQRGIKLFCRRQNVSKWKVKLEYVIVAKNVVDRFGMIDHRRGRTDIRSPDRPCVLHDYVMSDRVWDFILYPWHPRNDKVKGVRCIVLKDDLNLADGGAVDMFQFIYSLTYLYVFSLPFQNGGLSQPAPIKYAKKYAETFGQMITKEDDTLDDLILSERLNRPHIVHVIDEEGLGDLCVDFTPDDMVE